MKKKRLRLMALLCVLAAMLLCSIGCSNGSAEDPVVNYIVVFDANNNTDRQTTQVFTVGIEQALYGNRFEREGYIFTGWNTESDGSGTPYGDREIVMNLTYEAGATVTLYAQWTSSVVNYTVVFDANDNTGRQATQVFTVGIGQALDVNNFWREGYMFNGWNTERNGSGTSYSDCAIVRDLTYEAGATVTLYAQWVLNYTVVFDANDNTGRQATQVFTGGIEQALDVNRFEREGYIFTGWNTERNGSGTPYTDCEIVRDLTYEAEVTVTLYAQWTPDTNVAYTVNHYQQNVYDDYYMLIESETLWGTTEDETYATAKIYTGFNAQPVTQVRIEPDGSTKIDIYYDRKIYTANIVMEGGSTNTPLIDGRLSGRYGAQFFIEQPTRDNYIFLEWSPSLPDTFGSEEYWLDADNDCPTFTAQWIKGDISVTTPQYNDISLTCYRDGMSVVLTAGSGYTDYSWRIDNVVVDGAESNILELDTTGWLRGSYAIYVEAQKDGIWYSKTEYIYIY